LEYAALTVTAGIGASGTVPFNTGGTVSMSAVNCAKVFLFAVISASARQDHRHDAASQIF